MNSPTEAQHPVHNIFGAFMVLGSLIIVFVILTAATIETLPVSIPAMTAATCYILTIVAGVWRHNHPRP
jgi:hypothetical protein